MTTHQPGPTSSSTWTVHTDHVSMVRAPMPARPLRFDARPLPIEVDLARTCLVVIDMQNDFCHPEGWFGRRGNDLTAARRPIPVIAGLADAIRAAGSRVIWLTGGIPAARPTRPAGTMSRGGRTPEAFGYGDPTPGGRGPVLVQGSFGAAQIAELPPGPGDIEVFKQRLSGFWDSEFDSVLRQAGITTLLFAGINTDRCVFSTLQDAAFLGYDCVLVEDACGTPSEAYVVDAIHFLVRQLHGFTATSAQLIAALSGQARAPEAPR
ncbi:MAG: isochorismatase family cysteine hydrolase [bacterium]